MNSPEAEIQRLYELSTAPERERLIAERERLLLYEKCGYGTWNDHTRLHEIGRRLIDLDTAR